MRQKLGVIRAMVHRPELLVLDEPTTGVDPVSRADLGWLIARAAAKGAAVALTTAYLDEAERAAWLLALDDGRALAVGAPEDIAAAVPGTIRTSRERPGGEAARRAWRRGASWRIWAATDTEAEPHGEPVRPDLHDAVTVAALARELAATVEGRAA
jgi:ABC-2 type transport system ATP-binding protein